MNFDHIFASSVRLMYSIFSGLNRKILYQQHLPCLEGPPVRGTTEELVSSYFEALMKTVSHIFNPCKNPKHTQSPHNKKWCYDCVQLFQTALVFCCNNWHRVIDTDPMLAKKLLGYGRKYLIKFLKYFNSMKQNQIDKNLIVCSFARILFEHDFSIATSHPIKPYVNPIDIPDNDNPTCSRDQEKAECIINYMKIFPGYMTTLVTAINNNRATCAITLDKHCSRKHCLFLDINLFTMLIATGKGVWLGNRFVLTSQCPHLEGEKIIQCTNILDISGIISDIREIATRLREKGSIEIRKKIDLCSHIYFLKKPKWSILKRLCISWGPILIIISDWDFEAKCIEAADKLSSFGHEVYSIMTEKAVKEGCAYYCQTPGCLYSDAIMQIDVTRLNKGNRNGFIPRPPKFHIICPACDKNTCINCKTQHRHEEKCDMEALERALPLELKKAVRKMTPCPKCKHRCEKNGGCDHMKCPNCDYSYCYGCGEGFTGYEHLFEPSVILNSGITIESYMCIPTFYRLLFLTLDFFLDSVVKDFHDVNWENTIALQMNRSLGFLNHLTDTIPFLIENKIYGDSKKIRLTLKVIALNIGGEYPVDSSLETLQQLRPCARRGPGDIIVRPVGMYPDEFHHAFWIFSREVCATCEFIDNLSDNELIDNLLSGCEIISTHMHRISRTNEDLNRIRRFNLNDFLTNNLLLRVRD
jgi:hypothetical protein